MGCPEFQGLKTFFSLSPFNVKMTLWRLINNARLDSWPVKHFSLLFDGVVSAGMCCQRFVLDPLKFSTVRVDGVVASESC